MTTSPVNPAGATDERGPAVPGVEPLDQRRLSVVCRAVRVDVSLPAHLDLVGVVPELVTLVRERLRATATPGTPDTVDEQMGAGRPGSWQLSRVSGAPLSLSETLSQHGVHDGEILVLERRPVPSPPPLFDDALEALTDPEVTPVDQWDARDSATLAAGVTALALVLVALALATRRAAGPHGWVEAPFAAAVGLVCLAVLPVVARLEVPKAVRLLPGAGATVYCALAAAAAVPGAPGAGHALAAASVAAGVSASVWAVLGRAAGHSGQDRPESSWFLVWGLAATIAALATAGAILLPGVSDPGPIAVVLGMVAISAAPAVAVATGAISLPPVPAPGETAATTAPPELPAVDELRRAAGSARRTLLSVSAGGGIAAVVGALWAPGAQWALAAGGPHEWWARALAAATALALLLRGLWLSDRTHSAILYCCSALVATGLVAGLTLPGDRPLTAVLAGLALAVVAIAAGIAATTARLTPTARAAVTTLESIVVVSLVPLALGALGVYSLARHR